MDPDRGSGPRTKTSRQLASQAVAETPDVREPASGTYSLQLVDALQYFS
jgi:hypothetical protein